jgi:hypothetical protein
VIQRISTSSKVQLKQQNVQHPDFSRRKFNFADIFTTIIRDCQQTIPERRVSIPSCILFQLLAQDTIFFGKKHTHVKIPLIKK